MKSSRLALLASSLAILIATSSARAQGPSIPNMSQRSGLIGRFAPMMKTNLPVDPDRDTFYGTYYGNQTVGPKNDNLFVGGIYGQRLDPGCTTCRSPYFYGTSSRAQALCPDCLPKYKTQFGRVGAEFLHRWRPVGSYYQNGCNVPIYDFRPLVPGPGQDLWPWYINGSGG